MMKRFYQTPGILSALFLFYLLPPTVKAGPVTTSVQVPLVGTVFVPLGNDAFDQVPLSGAVHVETYFNPAPSPLQPGDPMRIGIGLNQVSGVGDLTGLKYIATGANRINFPTIPPDPVNLSFDLRAMFHPTDPVIPPDPVQPGDRVVPVDVSFLLTFDPDTGALLNVNILSMSVPLP